MIIFSCLNIQIKVMKNLPLGMMGGSMEMSMPNFMKDLAMSGASFYMSSTYSE